MALKVLAFMFAVIIGVSHSLPAGYDTDDVELVNPSKTRNYGHRQFDFDHDLDFGFDAFPFPDLSRIFDTIQKYLTSSQGTVINQDFLEKHGNKTTKTQLIHGRCYEITRTEYIKDGVYAVTTKTEMVDPSKCSTSSTQTTPVIEEISSTTNPSAPEDIETFGNNDKDNEHSNKYDNIESFEDVDYDQRHHYDGEEVEEIDGNNIKSMKPQRPYDYSRDTYVNDLRAKQGAPHNPDAEIIEDTRARMGRYDNIETFDHEDFDRRNHYEIEGVKEMTGNDIGSIEFYDPKGPQRPYDYSRDTYVNDLLAQRGTAHNPDAEAFDIESMKATGRSLRKRNA